MNIPSLKLKQNRRNPVEAKCAARDLSYVIIIVPRVGSISRLYVRSVTRGWILLMKHGCNGLYRCFWFTQALREALCQHQT